MITGVLYVALVDGSWLTFDCSRLRADPDDAAYSYVLVLEYPPSWRDRGEVYTTRALDSATPPTSGANIYVPN